MATGAEGGGRGSGPPGAAAGAYAGKPRQAGTDRPGCNGPGGGPLGHRGHPHRRHRAGGRAADGAPGRSVRHRPCSLRILAAGRLLPARHSHAGPGGAAFGPGRADGDVSDSWRRRQSRDAVRPDALLLRRADFRPSLGQHAGGHHGARVRAGDGAMAHPQGAPLQPGGDAGYGIPQPAGVHGPVGGWNYSRGGFGAAGRFLLVAVVHTDERALLRLPGAGRRDHLSVLPRRISNSGPTGTGGHRPRQNQTSRDQDGRHHPGHCPAVVHRLRSRAASGRARPDCHGHHPDARRLGC